jgi:NADPH:quinone reductase
VTSTELGFQILRFEFRKRTQKSDHEKDRSGLLDHPSSDLTTTTTTTTTTTPSSIFIRLYSFVYIHSPPENTYHSSKMTSSPSSSSFESIPLTMKAVVVRAHGGVEALSYETDYPAPTLSSLADHHVLVKNSYAGLNFIDTYYRSGLYQPPSGLPFVAGQEGGGIVVAVGKGVAAAAAAAADTAAEKQQKVNVGDTVVYMTFGSYCEYTAVPVDKIVKLLPDDDKLDLPTALACMVQGLTAHYLTTDATTHLVQNGDWCLIYAVGSGTCQWAAQMAKKKQGYKVIGTTSKDKASLVPASGACDELIVLDNVDGQTYSDYTSVDIVQRVLDITNGAGCQLILDGIGASTADISMSCLARRGLWISFGNASGPVPPLSLLKLSATSAYVTRPKLLDYIATVDELQRRAREVFAWVLDGTIAVTVDQVFPLQRAPAGHAYLEAGQSKGKVLFKIF